MEQPPVDRGCAAGLSSGASGYSAKRSDPDGGGTRSCHPGRFANRDRHRRPNRDVGLTLLRDGETVQLTVRPVGQGKHEYGDIGVLPNSNPMVDSVISGDIAQSAGFQAGDIVLAINGDPVVTSDHFRQVVGRIGEQESVFTIRRGDGISNWNCERHRRIAATARRSDYISDPTKSFKPGPLEAVP